MTPEDYLIGCCLIDEGVTLAQAHKAGLRPHHLEHRSVIYSHLLQLREEGIPIGLETLVPRLGPEASMPDLMALTDPGNVATTARAGHHIRELLKAANVRSEIIKARAHIEALERGEVDVPDVAANTVHRTPFSFKIPAKDDRSILLGNRYLNRGDGMVVVSSSGMGKSSLSHQMSSDWALGEAFHGIKPNGQLKILIVQSEDSDGDIAEVWQSIKHVRKFTDEQIASLEQNIRIISEKSRRGTRFLTWLATEIESFTPDLVMLNPLQAFIDGDVTDSRDIGKFLREGLNGMNNDRFGWLIIHHTTKPATGKDRGERQWHEVMYDMAGGAEIINWARGIISLRATEEPGKFRVVMAKRGRRAGITKKVEQGAAVRLELVTMFGLQHSSGFLPGPNGERTDTGIIYWEAHELPENEKVATSKKPAGREPKYLFSDYRTLFPPAKGPGMTVNELCRALLGNGEIKQKHMHQVCKRWADEGDVEIIDIHGQPRRYRATV